MKEIWKDIESYEGMYQVSSLGRVKSLSRRCSTHWGTRLVPEKLLCPNVKEAGYLCLDLHKDGKSKEFSIHRLVAQAFIPNPNNLPEVNHKDGDKQNNCVDNLEWCTNLDNVRHAIQNGLISRAQLSHFQKCGTSAVSKKVICLNTSMVFDSLNAAGRYFNVSSSTIFNIINKAGCSRKLNGIQLEYYQEDIR